MEEFFLLPMEEFFLPWEIGLKAKSLGALPKKGRIPLATVKRVYKKLPKWTHKFVKVCTPSPSAYWLSGLPLRSSPVTGLEPVPCGHRRSRIFQWR